MVACVCMIQELHWLIFQWFPPTIKKFCHTWTHVVTVWALLSDLLNVFFFWFLMVGRLLKRLSLLLVVVVHPAYTWASYSFSRIYNWSPLTTPVNSLVRAFWSSLPLSSGLIKLRFVVNTRYGFIIIPSLHFKLDVNPIFSSIIKKANSLVTKCIKVWLGLSLWLQWQYYITLRF